MGPGQNTVTTEGNEPMDDVCTITTAGDEDAAGLVEIGDAASLTEGQGGGNSEDKRRAYNS
ncbi:albusnodin family lasso peptide [Streptomyces sp. NRRL F-5123]|uniref:albusnodin family lasso peptide n=1 Tax=Streptomyces sp. NRRL F-5123 TaxID=1463856 RepID=UPI002D21EA63|nr:albusnodin family lasso peptide [Streptomyces sp. NRRL F-5123]